MSRHCESVEAKSSKSTGELRSADLCADLSPTKNSSALVHKDHSGCRESNRSQDRHLIHRGFLPDTRIKHDEKVEQSCANLLISSKANTEDKLRAIEKLVADGTTSLVVKNADGQSIAVRLEVEKVGHRRMVHMFVQDDCGREKTVLRGISKGDHYERERNRKGEFVSYEGPGARLLCHAKSIAEEDHSKRVSRGEKYGPSTKSSVTDGCKVSNNSMSFDGADTISKGDRFAVSTSQNIPKFTADAVGTAYYPCNNALEGGFKDKLGKDLCTLEAFLNGDAPYVSVAMDKRIPYGTKLCIPELNAKYGRNIEFRVVDTGGAFTGKGHSRIDICVADASSANDSTINGNLTLQFV